MSKILRFAFNGTQDQEAVESDMALAIFAAECIHGRPRVRMETRYLVSLDGKSCAMELAGDAGEAAARVFAGLVSARLGEDGVSISHCPILGNLPKVGESETTPQQARS